MLYSQIRTPWNSNNDLDLSPWIGEQPCMQMDLWKFSRNAYICFIPGKLSENHLHARLFSNPCGQVLKSIKSRGQIFPMLLRRKRTFPHGLENNHACKWTLDNFPGIIGVSIPGKLSELHLHAWLFSNPCGKVLIFVGISWSPDLRVQHIHHNIYVF